MKNYLKAQEFIAIPLSLTKNPQDISPAMAETYLAGAQRASALVQTIDAMAHFGTRLGDMVKLCEEQGKERLRDFKGKVVPPGCR